jgi:hypothetical protein
MTAVEWLIEQLVKNGILHSSDIAKAKEMEKEQMKQIMWDLTDIDMTKTNKGLVIDNMFEQYYNETFKSEQRNDTNQI